MYELWATRQYQRAYSYWRYYTIQTADPSQFPMYPNVLASTWFGQPAKFAMGSHSGGDGANYGFADSHAKYLKRQALSKLPWDAAAMAANAKNLLHYDERFK
jgi:prepilin-type processing-associated H-X9-DG protein